MNPISPKKLLHSKWTSLAPQHKEKHFTITEVEYDEQQRVIHCILQAVINHHEYAIEWRTLKDAQQWRTGWH